MTNVARQAKATRVNVGLKEHAGILKLKIMDNGKGIKEEDIYSPESLGIIGMRERLYPFGGELKLVGTPEKGTTLLIQTH